MPARSRCLGLNRKPQLSAVERCLRRSRRDMAVTSRLFTGNCRYRGSAEGLFDSANAKIRRKARRRSVAHLTRGPIDRGGVFAKTGIKGLFFTTRKSGRCRSCRDRANRRRGEPGTLPRAGQRQGRQLLRARSKHARTQNNNSRRAALDDVRFRVSRAYGRGLTNPRIGLPLSGGTKTASCASRAPPGSHATVARASPASRCV